MKQSTIFNQLTAICECSSMKNSVRGAFNKNRYYLFFITLFLTLSAGNAWAEGLFNESFCENIGSVPDWRGAANWQASVTSNNCKWIETDITEITSGDEVVVTMISAVGVTYALPSDQSTSSTPQAMQVKVVDGSTLESVPTTIRWIISKEDDKLTFESLNHAGYVLNCTNANDGVRVSSGSNKNKIFVIDPTSGYLKNTQTTDARYLGVHNTNYYWYCYKTYGNNTGGQTLKFYKKTCLSANEYWVNYELENSKCSLRIERVDSNTDEIHLEFVADDGYSLPNSIEVQMENGVLSYTWDPDAGRLIISQPNEGFTGDITIRIVGAAPEIDVVDTLVTSIAEQKVKVNVPIRITNVDNSLTIDATIDNDRFNLNGISPIVEGQCTLSIAYTPTEYNIVEEANVTLTAKIGEKEIANKSFTIIGRSLPEHFVIATKVGANWYALPANMGNATNPEGVLIEVDEATMTATAPNTTSYTLFPVKTTTGSADRYAQFGDRVRFSAVNNGYKGLWVSSAESTIRNYAVIDEVTDGSSDASYEWKISTTIVNGNWQYTLQTDQPNNQKYLRYWAGASGAPKWGTYAAGNNQLYFLPVTETEPFDYQVVEWYPTKMLIQTDAAIANPIAKIGDEQFNDITCTNKGDKLYEIAGLPLANNPTKVLTIKFSNSGNNYTNATAIPVIISQSATTVSSAPFTTLTKDVYNNADLVVRDGATLTIDGGTHAENTFFNVTIYPTSKISVPEGKKLTVHSLTFFGGIDEIYDGSTYTLNKYGVPELSLKGTLYKSIAKMDYVMRVDLNQMYSLTVPYDVQLADIKYWDGSDIALGSALYVSAYDGEARANQSKKTWIYETDFESKLAAATLKAGVGYTISAELQAGVGNEYSILRMPMMSNVANDATEAAKTVAVTAYGKDTQVTDNHKGWNLVGNPYMASIEGADDNHLVLGYLQETGTGPWEWVNDGIRYVTIPSDDGTYYWQQKFTDAVLPPFKNFFVQIGTTGELQFGLGTRQSMPARSIQAAVEKEVEFEILMSNDARQDNTGLLISEDYSPAYEINADLEKMTGAMSVYTIYGGYKLAYNALSPINASEWIPVGYIAPTAGEYTFRIDDIDKMIVEHVYLIDYEMNNVVDLLDKEYGFNTATGKNEHRFALKITVRDKNNTTTGCNIVAGNATAPIKFVCRDKIYIRSNGVIYDSTGKQVTDINK